MLATNPSEPRLRAISGPSAKWVTEPSDRWTYFVYATILATFAVTAYYQLHGVVRHLITLADQHAQLKFFLYPSILWTLMGTLLFLFPEQIAGLYLANTPTNADVVRRAALFLHVAAIFQLVDGQQVVASLSLRGMKDARAPTWIAGRSYWVIPHAPRARGLDADQKFRRPLRN